MGTQHGIVCLPEKGCHTKTSGQEDFASKGKRLTDSGTLLMIWTSLFIYDNVTLDLHLLYIYKVFYDAPARVVPTVRCAKAKRKNQNSSEIRNKQPVNVEIHVIGSR